MLGVRGSFLHLQHKPEPEMIFQALWRILGQ